MIQTTPYGSWKSPITADMIVADSLRLGEVQLDNGNVYWSESRPQEKGRTALLCRDADGRVQELVPPPYNVRTRVNEYGGASFEVEAGVVYFTNNADQRIYVVEDGQEPRALTPENDKLRYADFVIDRARGLLYCVVEDHSGEGEEADYLAAVDLNSGEIRHKLDEGNDFYGYPALSPDGSKIAYLTWEHPNMPWDGTELFTAELDAQGRASRREFVAGGTEESVFQPQWSPNGTLVFVSDRSEWWNFYCLRTDGVAPLLEMEAEFGLPQWVFGMSTYGFASGSTIYCTYTQDGVWKLGMLDIESGALSELDTPFTSFSQISVGEEGLACISASASIPPAVRHFDFWNNEWTEVQPAFKLTIDAGYLSTPEAVEFPTANGLTAYGLYYAPQNKDMSASDTDIPPLLVMSHGGPTAATSSALSLKIQYWTSRGIAVLDVNYGGSTGYGRGYRTRLNGNWGIVDVQDCENGANYLAEQGLADPERLMIRGSSAGGYTTLCALTFGNTFKAGASLYGIGDLGPLAEHSHKFESRYMESMVGKWPEDKAIYDERSPIQHTDKLDCPVIFFQGLDDKVVPPEQSQSMFEAVRAKKLPTAYLPFEGEQHGFRQAHNIKRALEAELYFYGKVFGFEIADDVEPVEIENL